MKSLLGALRALRNISSDYGEDLFVDELLVYYEWSKARYEVEEEENEKQERKLKDCFRW